MQTIGVLVRGCLESFDSVLTQPTNTETTTDAVFVLAKIKDEQDRFKVWSGNIGAHRRGTSSLDYRLRDASNLREEVQSLLQDLLEALADTNKILDGEVQPWDEEMSLECEAEQQDDDAEVDGFSFESELEQLLADISETVKYLYKVSAGLRNASQHDRVMSSLSINMAHFETYDIEHVRNKHPKIEDEIAQRLGKAISKRRHYFKYRESHRGKLGSGLEADGDRLTDGKSTIASSLPDVLKKADLTVVHLNVEDTSESGFTQTSFATSVADSTSLRIPPPPKEARTQEYFECPFCFMMISAQTRRAWKRHVFSDLCPYVCLYADCPSATQVFARRHHWAEHIHQQHWRIWKCPLDNSEPFQSQEAFATHIRHKHPDMIGSDQMETLLTACERPNPDFISRNCQFCDEQISSSHHYQKHIGRHLEQLALFALPANYDTDGSVEDDAEKEHDRDSGTNSMPLDPDTRPADQHDVQPKSAYNPQGTQRQKTQ
ncbi:hypothetical protein PG990_014694 [Apiospora arundinis]